MRHAHSFQPKLMLLKRSTIHSFTIGLITVHYMQMMLH